MYEELVQLLKDKAERFDYDGWVDTAVVMEKAADAIEELSKRVASEIALEECWHRLENRPLPDIPKLPKEEAK